MKAGELIRPRRNRRKSQPLGPRRVLDDGTVLIPAGRWLSWSSALRYLFGWEKRDVWRDLGEGEPGVFYDQVQVMTDRAKCAVDGLLSTRSRQAGFRTGGSGVTVSGPRRFADFQTEVRRQATAGSSRPVHAAVAAFQLERDLAVAAE